MKYSRFEELRVWKAAIEWAAGVYKFTSSEAFAGKGSLRDQMERAAVSVSKNIAEGFERGTKQELISFLYIARGSAGEVRSTLCLIERMPSFSDFKSEISNLKLKGEEISRQLRGWADFLQESPIKGQRYLTEKARKISKARQEREEFLKELRQEQSRG